MTSTITGTVNIDANKAYSDVDVDDALFNISSATLSFIGDDTLAHSTFAGNGNVVNDGTMSIVGSDPTRGVTLDDSVDFTNSGELSQDVKVVCGDGVVVDNVAGATWTLLYDGAINGGPGAIFNNAGTLDVNGESGIFTDFYDTGTIVIGSLLVLAGSRNVIKDIAEASVEGGSEVDISQPSTTFLENGANIDTQLNVLTDAKLWSLGTASVDDLVMIVGSKVNVVAGGIITALYSDIVGTINGGGAVTLESQATFAAANLWASRITATEPSFYGKLVSTSDLQFTNTTLNSGAALDLIGGNDALGTVSGSAPILIGNAATVAGVFEGQKISNDGVLDASGNLGSLFGSGTIDVADASNAASFHYVSAAQVLDFTGDASASVTIAPFDFEGSVKNLGDDTVDMSGSWNVIGYLANAMGTGGALSLSNGTATVSLNMLGDYSATGFTTTTGSPGITSLGYHAPAG